MILWLVLFVLIVAISFVLAAQSMHDYHEIPTEADKYALFLVRKTQSLNQDLLNLLHEDLLSSKGILSFEKLYKGDKSALVVFGSINILSKYKDSLDLLELEDYTNVDPDLIGVSLWEVGIKRNVSLDYSSISLTAGTRNRQLPQFLHTEQFWWQLILSPKNDKTFNLNIRAVVISSDLQRRKNLTDALQNLASGVFVKLPKAFSNEQVLDFYKKRSFSKIDKNPSVKQLVLLHLLQPLPQTHFDYLKM